MKNILYSSALAILAITTFSNEYSLASPAQTLQNCQFECLEGLEGIDKPRIDPLANEVISLVQKTFEKNFTTNIDFSFDITGEHLDWNNNKTTYSVLYDINDASITKNKNAYHSINNNQKLSISADGETEYLPLQIDATFSNEDILNFDTFQFTEKFSIDNITINENNSVRHIIEGAMEFVELFENKWIVLDIVEIRNEFPEIAEFIQKKQKEFIDESNINRYDKVKVLITKALESGYATIEKKGTEYTISFTPEIGNKLYISTKPPVQITLSTKDEKITNISILGSIEYQSFGKQDQIAINISSEISFIYKTIPVIFPKISPEDLEITNIIEMFLEFRKKDIIKESKKRMLYKNLNAFTGNSSDAIEFLNKNGTDNDKVFTREFITNAKNLKRRIRTQDLLLVATYYNANKSQMDYLAEDLAYSPYKNSKDYVYEYKNGFETLINAFQENEEQYEYVYIPWDIYDTLDYKLKTRGDILISLAKIRKAELINK